MRVVSGSPYLRRSFLQLGFAPLALAGRLAAFAPDHFWDTGSPSTWTPDQVLELTTKSPWAKSVSAELKSNGSNMAADGVNRSGGRGGRSGGRQSQSAGNPSVNIPKFQGTVRWASAKPLLEALKMKLPDPLKGHYVIAVLGLPITPGETEPNDDDPFSALKEETTLQLRKSESAQPEVAYQDPADTSSMYFGFIPAMLNLDNAKVVTFSMTSGPFAIRAKFNLAEMKYHGELAV